MSDFSLLLFLQDSWNLFVNNENPNFLYSQILAGIAILIDITSFQFKKREHILSCFVLAVGIIALHFFLLEQYTGAALMLIAMVRYLTSIFSTDPRLKYFFLLTAVGSAFFTYVSWVSLVALCASCINTIAAFSKNDKHLRLCMLMGTSFWIFHNVVVQTPMGVLMELIFLSSNMIGFYRFYLKKS